MYPQDDLHKQEKALWGEAPDDLWGEVIHYERPSRIQRMKNFYHRLFWGFGYCDGDGHGGGFRIIWLGFWNICQDRSYEKWWRGWSVGLNRD